MIERFSQFPAALASRCQTVRFGSVPALLAHPDWERPAPVMLWMHGRSVNKELDPGRYLRWIRAGIAACAVDLPGHGERFDAASQTPSQSLNVLSQMLGELDGIVAALGGDEYQGIFDLSRIAIGGMSLGGMVALRRLCNPHSFTAAAVECTTGCLRALYIPDPTIPGTPPRWQVEHDPALVEHLDPSAHLDQWACISLLALHNTGDQVVPYPTQEKFLNLLRARYASRNIDPAKIELQTFENTGTLQEHVGFGRFANDAKNIQTAFLARALRATPPVVE